MTNKNYTILSNRQLWKEIQLLNKKSHVIKEWLRRHDIELFQEVLNRTKFIDDAQIGKIPFSTRLYCLEHGLTQVPRCENPKCPTHGYVKCDKGYGFKHHCCRKCSKQDPKVDAKMRQTNRERIGVDYTWQSEEVLEKVQQTNLKNLGVRWPGQSEKCRKKFRMTNLDRIGVEYPVQSQEIMDRIKWKSNERYGGIGFASKELNLKVQNKVNELYGANNIAQTTYYHKKSHKKYTNPKYPELSFATTWEFKVYDFLTENHIQFEYQPPIAIPFDCEGTYHTYHPDFLVGDRIVEVKGDNFFKLNETTGKEEMYLTWKGDLSDEEYEWRCKVMEAKHQCMLANNVIILRYSQVKNLRVEMFV